MLTRNAMFRIIELSESGMLNKNVQARLAKELSRMEKYYYSEVLGAEEIDRMIDDIRKDIRIEESN